MRLAVARTAVASRIAARLPRTKPKNASIAVGSRLAISMSKRSLRASTATATGDGAMNGLMSKITTAATTAQQDDDARHRQQAAAARRVERLRPARARWASASSTQAAAMVTGAVLARSSAGLQHAAQMRRPARRTRASRAWRAPRACGRSTGTSSRTRPGRAASTSTCWPRKAASEIEWVTNRIGGAGRPPDAAAAPRSGGRG